MSDLEQRIRDVLDVEVPVSVERMLDAAAGGARRRRLRRTAGIVSGAAAAVVLALVAGTSILDRGSSTLPPSPIQTPKVKTLPPVSEWFADVESDGTSLYLTTHRCPESVRAGRCLAKGGFWDGRAPREPKAVPVTLWRHDETGWVSLGRPGVRSRAEMMALPGGLMFVPRRANAPADSTGGPLLVSTDQGKTWTGWELPWSANRCRPDRSPACEVVVSGDHVVATRSNQVFRRHLGSEEWENVSPSTRGAGYDPARVKWGLLSLDDGALVLTANDIFPARGKGFYWVSRDAGSTWSKPHPNPGQETAGHGAAVVAAGPGGLYAECEALVASDPMGDSSRGCGVYRSTDLAHWTELAGLLETDAHEDVPVCVRGRSGQSWRSTDAATQSGGFIYALTYVPYAAGHEATRADLVHLDMPHRAQHVLERSADGCRTWAPVIP